LTLPAIAADYAERIAGSRWHVFEDSGHRPWAEQPEDYAAVVGGFLADG
jgi:pimeloyl-ACP methyl ester carboxylesterase